MANDASNPLTYFLKIDAKEENALGSIRHWPELSIGFEDQCIWIKGLTLGQMEDVLVKSIPNIMRYSSKNGKIFPLNSKLPERNEPSLLWTPIERGLRIQLPTPNNNFFGVEGKIQLKLIPSTEERTVSAMVCTLKELESYLITAPAIRMKKLLWMVLDGDKALVTGKPLLPIGAKVFWNHYEFIIPAGFDFDLSIFAVELNNKINPEKDHWILWNEDSSYIKLPKNHMEQLSLGSFRSTLATL